MHQEQVCISLTIAYTTMSQPAMQPGGYPLWCHYSGDKGSIPKYGVYPPWVHPHRLLQSSPKPYCGLWAYLTDLGGLVRAVGPDLVQRHLAVPELWRRRPVEG